MNQHWHVSATLPCVPCPPGHHRHADIVGANRSRLCPVSVARALAGEPSCLGDEDAVVGCVAALTAAVDTAGRVLEQEAAAAQQHGRLGRSDAAPPPPGLLADIAAVACLAMEAGAPSSENLAALVLEGPLAATDERTAAEVAQHFHSTGLKAAAEGGPLLAAVTAVCQAAPQAAVILSQGAAAEAARRLPELGAAGCVFLTRVAAGLVALEAGSGGLDVATTLAAAGAELRRSHGAARRPATSLTQHLLRLLAQSGQADPASLGAVFYAAGPLLLETTPAVLAAGVDTLWRAAQLAAPTDGFPDLSAALLRIGAGDAARAYLLEALRSASARGAASPLGQCGAESTYRVCLLHLALPADAAAPLTAVLALAAADAGPALQDAALGAAAEALHGGFAPAGSVSEVDAVALVVARTAHAAAHRTDLGRTPPGTVWRLLAGYLGACTARTGTPGFAEAAAALLTDDLPLRAAEGGPAAEETVLVAAHLAASPLIGPDGRLAVALPLLQCYAVVLGGMDPAVVSPLHGAVAAVLPVVPCGALCGALCDSLPAVFLLRAAAVGAGLTAQQHAALCSATWPTVAAVVRHSDPAAAPAVASDAAPGLGAAVLRLPARTAVPLCFSFVASGRTAALVGALRHAAEPAEVEAVLVSWAPQDHAVQQLQHLLVVAAMAGPAATAAVASRCSGGVDWGGACGALPWAPSDGALLARAAAAAAAAGVVPVATACLRAVLLGPADADGVDAALQVACSHPAVAEAVVAALAMALPSSVAARSLLAVARGVEDCAVATAVFRAAVIATAALEDLQPRGVMYAAAAAVAPRLCGPVPLLSVARGAVAADLEVLASPGPDGAPLGLGAEHGPVAAAVLGVAAWLFGIPDPAVTAAAGTLIRASCELCVQGLLPAGCSEVVSHAVLLLARVAASGTGHDLGLHPSALAVLLRAVPAVRPACVVALRRSLELFPPAGPAAAAWRVVGLLLTAAPGPGAEVIAALRKCDEWAVRSSVRWSLAG